MPFIDSYKPQIEALCRKHKVKRLFVFGSVLTERFAAESDVDMLVDFEGVELAHYADNYYNFKFALEEALRHPIDLIEEQALRNPYFKQSVEAQRQLLYAA
jgi:uncharacterized protein